jgi:hypothetical protein
MERLTVDSTGTLDWAIRCDQSIAAWQTMIDWMRLLAHDDGRVAIASRLERTSPTARTSQPKRAGDSRLTGIERTGPHQPWYFRVSAFRTVQRRTGASTHH